MIKTRIRSKIAIAAICILLFAFCTLLTACGDACEHTYTGDCDEACDACGEVRETTVAHHYYGDCDQSCHSCGKERTVTVEHSWRPATCTAGEACEGCGAVKSGALGHEWTTPDVDLCEVQSTCARCGATDGENKEHTPADDDGDCTTAITCTVCGKATTPARERHTGGTATCLGCRCDICGKWYGDKNADNHASEEFTYTVNEDKNTHKKAHECCGVTAAEAEAHDLDNLSAKCRFCEAQAVAELRNYFDGTAVGFYFTMADAFEAIPEDDNYYSVHTYADYDGDFTIPENLFSFVGYFYNAVASERVVHNFGGTVINESNIDGGIFHGKVINRGDIDGGKNTIFNGELINEGTIEGGVMNGEVTNHGMINGGTFNGSIINHGNISNVRYEGRFTLGEDFSIVNNGTIECTYHILKEGTCRLCGEICGHSDRTHTASGNVITESCSVCKMIFGTATVTAENATYDGIAKESAAVTYSAGWTGGELIVTYVNNTNAGTATASITLGGATASVDFTVAQARPAYTTPVLFATYGQTLRDLMLEDGNPITATPGTWTWGSYNLDTLVGDVGENRFDITFIPADTVNYQTIQDQAIVIVRVLEIEYAEELTITLERESFVYDGAEKTPAVTSIIVNGLTLTEGTDYTVSYEQNVCVGERATAVIDFKGNYGGTFRRWFTITQDPATTVFDGKWVGNDASQEEIAFQRPYASVDTGCDLSLPIHIHQSEAGTEAPSVELVGQQLDIGSGISMKFHVRNNENRPLESITVEVEFLGEPTYLTECEQHPTEDKVYIYTFEGINPQCLGDPMNVTILVGGSPAEHENARLVDYSVEKNLLEIRKTADDATVQLIDDLLAYGKAASHYTKHDLMTGNYRGSGREIPESCADITGDSFITKYIVRFATINAIVIEVAESGISKVYLDGVEIANGGGGPNNYMIRGIAATDFDKEYTFNFHCMGSSAGTFTVSLNDYLYAVSQSENASAEMKALAKALYNYGVSAKAYDHAINGTPHKY